MIQNMFVGLSRTQRIVIGFGAGFLAVLLAQQPVFQVIINAMGLSFKTYSMTPTGPLAIPAVISSALWGGLWGVAFMGIRNRLGVGAKFWILSAVLGAILLALVFWFVAAPLKGMQVASGWVPARMLVALLVNAAWGLGWAILAVLGARMMGARGSTMRAA